MNTSVDMERPARRVQRRTMFWLVTLWIVAVEAALIAGSFVTASRIYKLFTQPPPPALLVSWALLGYFISALALRLYEVNALERLQTALERIARAIARAVIIVAIALFLLAASSEVSRVVFVMGFAFALLTLLLHRGLLNAHYHRLLMRAGPGTMLIVDDAEAGMIGDTALLHAADHVALRPDTTDPQSLDRFARFVAPFDRVVVACSQPRRGEWARVLQGAHVSGQIVAPEMLELKAVGVDLADGLGRITVSTPGMALHERMVKRALDVAVSGLALVVLSPLLAAVAIAIKLEDGGPILFRQQRVGRANRFFTMFKFRSMRVASLDPLAATSTRRGDDRVTRIGRFIRATSIDELPQLLNILLGQMSVVGPRPHALGSRAGNALFWEVSRAYWHRHVVKPGLTGLAQVRGLRGPTDATIDLQNRLNADLEYVKDWTVWRDVIIILRTAFVIRHDNAF